MILYKKILALILLSGLFFGCNVDEQAEPESNEIPDIAANPEIAKKLEGYEIRGDLKDETAPTPAKQALKEFEIADDLKMELLLSEPEVEQPLDISFDYKGRMWVVQYKQYPYPAGLKVTGLDNHLRFQYDKVPAPPPEGVKGADKISIFEDTNGDGMFDQSTDAVTGLNIATSVAIGRGKIWVLNPPYLLAYPDDDGDGQPDGEPEVVLKGFGLEDTHSVANSLRWGPDGWLYGADGSTTTSDISSDSTKHVSYEGQAIWRYHPETKVFEIFAEGGGNSFNVEIDSKGRIFSGHNGIGRGPYFKQGAYYIKSWGKHGPLTNAYAFGYLPKMEFKGKEIRFTHSLLRYDGGELPKRYKHQFIALNPLQGEVVLTNVEPNGSTLRTIDKEEIINTEDSWFRPQAVEEGPDGKVYITDWYDSRLSHANPRDTWSKTTGRIYRLGNKEETYNYEPFDLSKYSNEELIELLDNDNRWYRQKALQLFADRKDPSVVPKLEKILQSNNGQVALEAFWAINLSGGFDDEMAISGMHHENPYVRMWAARLVGDRRSASEKVGRALAELSAREPNVEVRSQLAATAKRLPGPVALPMIRNLLVNHDDAKDPDIPLQVWWALESKAESDRSGVRSLLESKKMWANPIINDIVLERLMKRYIMAGGGANYDSAVALLNLAPSKEYGKKLMRGLQDGLRGKDYSVLPNNLITAMKPYRDEGEGKWTLALRQNDQEALQKVLPIIKDQEANLNDRITYTQILGEQKYPEAVPVLLDIIGRPVLSDSKALKIVALRALQSYDNPEIGEKVLNAYPRILREDKKVRLAALSLLVSRPEWASLLLDGIQKSMQIHKQDIPLELANKMMLLGNEEVTQRVHKIWPATKTSTSDEINKQLAEVSNVVESGHGDPKSGKALFVARCGACHQLFGEGGSIGPDLTGYDRDNAQNLILQIINPSMAIREGYVNYRIKTKNGQVIVGRLTSRSKERVSIQPFAGEEITLAREEIATLEAQEQSLMPEGLLKGLSDQQVQDLFAFIMEKEQS